MTDLPLPTSGVPDVQTSVPQETQAQPQDLGGGVSSAIADPKLLQDKTIEQIEAVIVQTATNPAERAQQLQSIKAAYIRTRYGVDINGTVQ